MHERVLIAGSGGQGVILIGKILAASALKRIQHVTFLPAYGAEVRGGTSNCQVILSSEKIASPMAEEFDSMLMMNQASVNRFLAKMTGDCMPFINISLCRSPEAPHIPVNASETAIALGNARMANFVMLGAYIAKKEIVPASDIEDAIHDAFSHKTKDLANINIQALRAGLAYECA